MKNTEHHEINQVAVSVTDSHAQNGHHGEAQTGQQRVDHIQYRRNEQEQEFQRFGGSANHAGNQTGN